MKSGHGGGETTFDFDVDVMISVGRNSFCIFVNVLSTECQLVIVVKRKRNEVGIA